MKMTPEVIAALETLKKAAENDYERLTIERMEKAINEPPKIEQIDERHQQFNGHVYRCSRNDNHYERYEFLHVTVWEWFNGKVPAGSVVHHEDFNPANNDLSNLVIKTRSEHSRIHGKAPKKKTQFICEWCGKTYETVNNGINRFCSKKCFAAWRYKAGLDKEWRECVVCHKMFFTKKASQAKTCSHTCTITLREQKKCEKQMHGPSLACIICGADFKPKSKNQIYCSKECRMQARIKKVKEDSVEKTKTIEIDLFAISDAAAENDSVGLG